VATQKPFVEQIFEAVFHDDRMMLPGGTDDHGYIKQNLLFEFYIDANKKLNHGNGAMKNRTFYAKLDSWLKREKLPFSMVATAKIRNKAGKVSTADVVINDAIANARKGPLAYNDPVWYEDDHLGRKAWTVEVR